jgi:invasion protein IalB
MKSTFLSCAILIAAAAIVLSNSSIAGAAAPKPKPAATVPANPTMTTASYGNWVLRCITPPAAKKAKKAPSKQCEVVQTVQVQGQKQPLAQVAIGHLPNGDDLVLTAVLPVNVSLPGLVRLIDGQGKESMKLRWSRCVQRTCIAAEKMTDKVLQKLLQDNQGKLQFADANARAIAIPLSWVGLKQALTGLKKQ